MRLLLTFLTITLFSFGASAMTVGEGYKRCKAYQDNGFNLKGLSQKQILETFACNSHFRGILNYGGKMCMILNIIRKKEITLDPNTSGLLINSFANNPKAPLNDVIKNFIIFAENNPDLWQENVVVYTNKFLNNKFPCKID